MIRGYEAVVRDDLADQLGVVFLYWCHKKRKVITHLRCVNCERCLLSMRGSKNRCEEAVEVMLDEDTMQLTTVEDVPIK